MKKNKIRDDKGISLIDLVISIIVIMILTSIVLYNAKNDLKLNNLKSMKTDIGNLRDKIGNYYAQYGDIPAIKSKPFTDISVLNAANIIGANDTGNFYVIDLKSLENLTLNYGKEYKKIQENSNIDVNTLTDIYIINEDSYNIFYIKGIEVDENMYYTDYNEKDVDKERIDLIDIESVQPITPGKTATENKTYVNNGEAVIPKGFIIVPGCDDVSKGLVISDNPDDTEIDKNNIVANGNQFVWVPVTDMNKFVRQVGYYNGALDSGLSNFGEANGIGVNNKLNESIKTQTEAKSMYRSVESNGGFYIGRYETSQGENGKAEVKKDRAPWVGISWSNSDSIEIDEGGAVEAARTMYGNTRTKYGVTSTLCYGVQWDATLNFIDPNYITKANQDKKPNCAIDSYIVDSTGKGNYDSGGKINTGLKESYSIKNIYDMAGNVLEWTMETYESYDRVIRGGYYYTSGILFPSSIRASSGAYTSSDIGSRITLYV